MAVRSGTKKRAKTARVTFKSPSRPKQPAVLKLSDFEPLTELPALVLGVQIPEEHFDDPYRASLYNLRFKPGREWKKIVHETCGVACKPVYWIGTVLKPTTYAENRIRNLEQAMRGSNLGWKGSPTLAQLIGYQTLLAALLSAGCDKSYESYCEGLYPIDAGYAGCLTADELPPDLDELIEWESGLQRARGVDSRWSLAIFGPNGAERDKVWDR